MRSYPRISIADKRDQGLDFLGKRQPQSMCILRRPWVSPVIVPRASLLPLDLYAVMAYSVVMARRSQFDIRAAIVAELKRQHMTPYELALAVDILPRNIYRILSGKRGLSVDRASAMMRVLGLRIVRSDKR